jgi:hypothetical protein
LIKIIDKPSTETFYHITTKNPETMSSLTSYTERFLNITGLEVVIGTPSVDEMRNPPEELFDFSSENTDPIFLIEGFLCVRIKTWLRMVPSPRISVMKFFRDAWLLLFLLTGGEISLLSNLY